VPINLKALKQIKIDIQDTNIKLMIVTKTRSIEDISELIKLGYRNFAENRVQEAYKKFTNIKSDHKINLSLIGPLQSNKVKQALKLFDTIQSIDRNKIVDEINKNGAIITNEKKFYIQVNIGEEPQKSGVLPNNFNDLYQYCLSNHLEISGIMCIPPFDKDPRFFFDKMLKIKEKSNNNFVLSMGMSSDYKIALDYHTDEIRIGSLIFS
jgi:pyridoxal phosphate enzyme (YggS family)|tara:strand:- start:24 stop:650 length:627 start_codon:yes stop_codon:yes gene_type:complete